MSHDEPEQTLRSATRRRFLLGSAALASAACGARTGLLAPDAATARCTIVRQSDVPRPVLLLRDAGGFYAMSAACTHQRTQLRCPDERGLIRCPNHGAEFDLDGNTVTGPDDGDPAPPSLDHYRVNFTRDGDPEVVTAIVVDRAARFIPG